ncbi:MAG: protease inhibitor I42 family protein [Anaerolineales bacterium]|jgi:inhibitor of cysteine peptidase
MSQTYRLSTLTLVLLSIAVLPLAACGASGEVELDMTDNRSQVELEVGQVLVISLEGNPTTGYTWEIGGIEESVLRQVGEAVFEAESDLVGAGGVQTLRFEAVGVGQTSLALVYHRSWEEGVAPLETFSVQIEVR